MTRRITLAILLVVWLALIGAGLTTYFITRSVLIADLDDTIISGVANRPDVEPPSGRVVIQEGGRATSLDRAPQPVPRPYVIGSAFTPPLNGGTARMRTLTLKALKRRSTPDEPPVELTIVSSASAEHIDSLLRNLTYSLAAFGLAAVACSMLVARVVARVALRPMRAAADVIGEINERSLDRRIAVDHLPSELVPVAQKLNDMLARLETAFSQRRQFLADASHELRTPVAALVVTLEVALRRERDSGEYVRTLDRCLADARQLHQLVVALVNQARAERFAGDPDVNLVALSTLLRQCTHMVLPLADGKGVAVHRDIPENLMVLSDEQLLRSMVSNLLSNAVEYTPGALPGAATVGAPGRVSLSAVLLEPAPGAVVPKFIERAIPEGVKASARRLLIQVKDNGPGIPQKHLANIFEPFFRADAARSNPEHHLGLGLAMVQTNAQALGGTCRVESPPPGEYRGTLFTLELPTIEIFSATLSQLRIQKPAIIGRH